MKAVCIGMTKILTMQILIMEHYLVVYTIKIQGYIIVAGEVKRTCHFHERKSKLDNKLLFLTKISSFTLKSIIWSIFFRRDGPFEKEIQLPTSKPFYLLRFASPCQKVKGMHVREETVRFDDEDRNNANSVSGRPPMGAGGKNHRLMYCYYCTNLHTCD